MHNIPSVLLFIFTFIQSFYSYGKDLSSIRCSNINSCTFSTPLQFQVEKANCEVRKVTCKKNLNSISEGRFLKDHLIDCNKQSKCEVIEFKNMIRGCGSLLPEKMNQISKFVDNINIKIANLMKQCSSASNANTPSINLNSNIYNNTLKNPSFRQCLVSYFPQMEVPTFSQVKSFVVNQWSEVPPI